MLLSACAQPLDAPLTDFPVPAGSTLISGTPRLPFGSLDPSGSIGQWRSSRSYADTIDYYATLRDPRWRVGSEVAAPSLPVLTARTFEVSDDRGHRGILQIIDVRSAVQIQVIVRGAAAPPSPAPSQG